MIPLGVPITLYNHPLAVTSEVFFSGVVPRRCEPKKGFSRGYFLRMVTSMGEADKVGEGGFEPPRPRAADFKSAIEELHWIHHVMQSLVQLEPIWMVYDSFF